MKNSWIRRAGGWRMLPLALGLALGLAACGGGGGSDTTSAPTPVAAAATDSSGAISAFGSVFVNGHRFNTDHARLIDDDTGAVTPGVSGLEVGVVVDVKKDAAGTEDAPIASELHVHPLARGFVDAADATAGTLTVMGQSVQLTSATTFSDHRACLAATTSPCTAIANLSAVVPSTGTGTATTAGSYVTVHGYLFSTAPGSANIVATLVSVGDAPTGTGIANFKAEGVVTVGTATLTIGALKLDLSKANCFAPGKTACSSAFTSGEVVSAGAATAPASPATTLVADFARVAARLPVETAGATVEVEGAVASTSTATFVVRGITIDTSGLAAGTALPAAGDIVRVVGTIASNGKSVTATSVTIVHAANAVTVGLEGDAGSVSAGTTGTFTLSVLGQSITVNAQTRLADMSVRGWDHKDPVANPFNITTFQTYLAASASKHVVVKSEADATGALFARSLAIVPASSEVSVAGVVDSTPAVVNSTATGTPTTFSVHGIAVKADPAAITSSPSRRFKGGQSVAPGDYVVAVGTLNGAVVTVGPTIGFNNVVVDVGPLNSSHRDRGMF